MRDDGGFLHEDADVSEPDGGGVYRNGELAGDAADGFLGLPDPAQLRLVGWGESDVTAVEPGRAGGVDAVSFEGEVDGTSSDAEFVGDDRG